MLLLIQSIILIKNTYMYTQKISRHCVGMDLFVIVLMDRVVHDTPFVVAVAVVHVDCSCGASFIVTRTVLLLLFTLILLSFLISLD